MHKPLTKLLFLLYMSSTLLLAEDVLKIAGWDVYSDPDNANKTIGYEAFEEKFKVKIEFLPLNNLDDIIEVAESDVKYDVFIISNEGISILHDMGLVKSLDLKLLPQYQSLHPSLQYISWAQFDSHSYAVAWAWGPTGLMYNKDEMSKPDSWEVLWDEKYKGRVAMWNDVSMIWTTALTLGYKNVYSLTRAQLKEVKLKLIEFNKLKARYYEGGGDELQLAISGKIVAYNSWYDPSWRLKKSGKNFSMVIPKEGAVGMFDSYMISEGSTQSALVHQYINHQISPKVQKEMVEITGLSPSNIETLALLSVEQIKELHLNDHSYFNKLILWDNMPRKNLYDKVLKEVRQDYKKRLAKRK